MQNSNEKSPGERRVLARGLESLLGPRPLINQSTSKQNIGYSHLGRSLPSSSFSATQDQEKIPYKKVSIKNVKPNPSQPRKTFNESQLGELADSIREHGLIQPILVKSLENDQFEIIAGERRYRAALIAGLEEIPVVIAENLKKQEDQDLAAIIENIQREDLNPLELAVAYERIINQHKYTQEQLAKKLGKSRVSIANQLRLLRLPADVREMLRLGRLTEGHARALLSLEDENEIRGLASKVIELGLSVRETEVRARSFVATAKSVIGIKNQKVATDNNKDGSIIEFSGEDQKDPGLLSLEDELRRLFGTKVTIRGKRGGGVIELYFSNKDSLHRLVHQLRTSQK